MLEGISKKFPTTLTFVSPITGRSQQLLVSQCAAFYKVNIMTTAITGGWSSFDYEVTSAAKAVFKEALEGFVGVKYQPSAFATQIVAGTNYCFLCTGEVVIPESPHFPALLYIFKPLNGKAHISEIKRIHP